MINLYHGWRLVQDGFGTNQPLRLDPMPFGTMTVRVRKSARWIQEGTTLSAGTTLRVCVGNTPTDISIDASGNLTAPIGSGWSSGSNEVFFNFNSILPEYPLEDGLGQFGNLINLGGSPPGGVLNPPGGGSELNGMFNRTRSELVVYAYEITDPTPEFTNPINWQPNWQFVAEGEFSRVTAVDPALRDQQEVSIFGAKIIVSQSSYGAQFVSTLTTLLGADKVPSGTINEDYNTITSAQSGEVLITIDPAGFLVGTPIYNPNPYIYGAPIVNFPPRPGGGGTDKSPRDSGGGGGSRPIIFPSTGGGGTPANDQFIALEVTPDPIAFDPTDVGTQRSRGYLVRNIGTVSVEIDEISSSNVDNSFSFGMSSPLSIPFTIDPDEQFGGVAYFIPASAISYNELGYLKNGGNIIRSFGVTGTGTASGNPGDTILRRIALFGDVSTSGDTNFLEHSIGQPPISRIIKAVNAGATPITLSSVSLGGSGVFTSPGITAGFSLLPGTDTNIIVSFEPVGAQEYIGTLTLNSNAQTSTQPGFNPVTGAITCNLRGEGTPEQVLTRIMSFNVQNNGTFEDALAGGSATTELDVTITNIGNATLGIYQFQVQSPFTLELDAFGTYTVGSFEFYLLDEPLYIPKEATSAVFKVKFTPPTATNYVDDVLVVSNKTLGPESFEVRGFGTFEEPEPEEPSGPILPDDEPPPGQEFDPGTVPSSALDGNGAACIPKECEVVYVYEYSANGDIVT